MLESIFIIIAGTALVLVFFAIMRNRILLFLFFKKTTTRFRRLRKFEASIENSQESLKKLASRRVVLLEFFQQDEVASDRTSTLNHSGQIGRLTRNKLARYKKELGN
jgi:hypothetical protein